MRWPTRTWRSAGSSTASSSRPGLQTHTLPAPGDPLLDRIARSLGFASERELERDLDKTRRRVAARFASLSREGRAEERGPDALERLLYAFDAGDESAVLAWLSDGASAAQPRFGATASPDLARHLLALARRPDYPLGAATRDKFLDLAPVLVEALSDAADPEQAARMMAAFFARLGTPSVYARALAEDPRAARALVALFGASAFLGASMVGHPELADRLLFGRGAPTPESARRAIDEELAALGSQVDVEDFVGALRRAKGRVTMEVGLADLAGELTTRACTLVLSALADAALDRATRFALESRGARPGGGPCGHRDGQARRTRDRLRLGSRSLLRLRRSFALDGRRRRGRRGFRPERAAGHASRQRAERRRPRLRARHSLASVW